MYSNSRRNVMLALRLPADIEKRLDSLAKKTGRSKSFYAREAILRHLEDLEDYYLARRRLAHKSRRVTLEELERELGETRRRGMSQSPVWRVEFDADAVRDLRKLGATAERAILRYLRQRIATSDDPRRFGKPLTGDLKGF